jgi:hypothetical protein
MSSDNLFRLSQTKNGIFAVEGTYDNKGTTCIFHEDLALMPSTGQYDKNKVEAYLGDIIEHDGRTYEIKWDDESIAFYCDGNDWVDDAKLIRWSKIIGHIYMQEKELLS